MSDARHSTRREFLKQTGAVGAAFAAPYVITSTALGGEGRPAASERIVMGGIGIGNMGGGDQGSFLGRRDVQYVAVCDVQEVHAQPLPTVVSTRGTATATARSTTTSASCWPAPTSTRCTSATPDHWHAIIAIEACRAGKDVYCQKPETHCLREGRLMVEAARRYGRWSPAAASGCWRTTGQLAQTSAGAASWARSSRSTSTCGPPSKPCNLAGEPSARGLRLGHVARPRALGPLSSRIAAAAASASTARRWRSWKDYSGGGMTDWGAHRFGGAMFAAGIADQGPVEIIPPNGKDITHLTYVFANGMRMYHCPNEGDARVSGPGKANAASVGLVGTGEPIPGKEMPRYKGTGGIYGDFIASVQTREKPFRDIEVSHRAVSVCHLGIIAYDLNRPLKWDPEKEVFPGDEEANRLLNHAMRAPWQI